VASDVKSLAVQTAKATEEIAAQILAAQGSTATAVKAIRNIGGRMQEISNYTSAVAASVEQQNAATGEISENVAGAATATRSSTETVLPSRARLRARSPCSAARSRPSSARSPSETFTKLIHKAAQELSRRLDFRAK
jgi:hypothetical protein